MRAMCVPEYAPESGRRNYNTHRKDESLLIAPNPYTRTKPVNPQPKNPKPLNL